MATPVIAYRKGYYHEVKAGKRYLWCSCGRSTTQPFCDGASHVGTDFLPMLFKAKTDEDVIFCGCKHTKTPPFCDGAHSNLPGGYRNDDPDSPDNQAILCIDPDTGPLLKLDNDCYLFSPARAELARNGVLAWCATISPALGALHQSQFYVEVEPGTAPAISADDRHTVLFVIDGEGEVEIGDRRFPIFQKSGVYVRPSEAYRITNPGPEKLRLFISNGPGSEGLTFLPDLPPHFEAEFPDRRADVDPDQRQAMAERSFQILVNKEHGSTMVTQFIGNIPLSKAEPHRHLYEETLIFLRGEGMVWTETRKARCQAGDVMFLPRKQLHSVQCVSEGGLDVVGVIYPGDNPSINY
jgi:mannose-6-phosphate isomerase-like protein (cupin superfamily)/CDGSH-type Zn-finger protein